MSLNASPPNEPGENQHPVDQVLSGGSLRNKFLRKEGCWYVMAEANTVAGPFSDKAEAQIALAYFSTHKQWPSAKQLREFARCGK